MPYRKILIATDGSNHALEAAEQAAEIATSCSISEVEVLGVAIEYSALKGRQPFMQSMQTEAEEAVDATARVLVEHGIQPVKVVKVATGNPGHTICEEAQRFGADLIVIGSRGHGAIGTLLTGSTGLHVVQCSPLPVLLVR
jgi:nucleotide-binding universal stress UspA family protein